MPSLLNVHPAALTDVPEDSPSNNPDGINSDDMENKESEEENPEDGEDLAY